MRAARPSETGAVLAHALTSPPQAAPFVEAARTDSTTERVLMHAPTVPVPSSRPRGSSVGPALAHACTAPPQAQPFVEDDTETPHVADAGAAALQHACTAPQNALASAQFASAPGSPQEAATLRSACTAPTATLRAASCAGPERQASVRGGGGSRASVGVHQTESARNEAALAKLLYADSECESSPDASRAPSPDLPPPGTQALVACAAPATDAIPLQVRH